MDKSGWVTLLVAVLSGGSGVMFTYWWLWSKVELLRDERDFYKKRSQQEQARADKLFAVLKKHYDGGAHARS